MIIGLPSSGKTYPSNALCISAIRQLKTVRYIWASILMGELERLRIKGCYLDDFGLMLLDLDKYQDFFGVIDARDGRKSTIFISQFPIKSWFDMFSDGTYAAALPVSLTKSILTVLK